MDGILNLFRSLGPARLVTIGFVTLLMVAFFAAVLTRLNTPDYGLLYGGLDAQEASQIVSRLDTMNVPYQVRGDGRIYVPDSQVPKLRLQMAGEGLVGGSTKGYEIFDNSSSFGTTSLVQNIDARRALEGELARTITSLPMVKSARVHLVMAKHQLFSQDATKATASVVLNLGSRTLSGDQIQSITHLVAAAVPNLEAADVTLVDNRGTLLSAGKGFDGKGNAMSDADKYRERIQDEYDQDLTQMLERVVGAGKVSVHTNADIDFDHDEQSAEIYDPDQQVARSEQHTLDNDADTSSDAGNQPAGVASNIPGRNQTAGSATRSTKSHSVDTINYEISRKVIKHITAPGAIKKLSVAVLVEGNYTEVDGQKQYAPLTDDQKAKLTGLVKGAIGFDAKRGDTVEVVDMPFQAIAAEPEYKPPFLTHSEIMRLAQYGLLLVGMLIMLVFVIRPIMRAATKQQERELASAEAASIIADEAAEIAHSETMIDLDKVEGRVRESTIRKVTEIIDKHPEQTVGVIRGWMASNSDATPST